VGTQDFDILPNSMKDAVVNEEPQCFGFPLPHDTNDKAIM
jgi:hypothetical protein